MVYEAVEDETGTEMIGSQHQTGGNESPGATETNPEQMIPRSSCRK